MGLLRTIFIILIVYYIFTFIARLAFPHLINRFAKNMEAKMREQQNYSNQQESKIGETVIDKKPQNKTSNDSVGEYVDYEEVD
ncbi:MAG TPA: DUF4834 family protein [Flavobacteriia bacterium]|nr:DUF4834 family protein [Flavobacteriia bacterium]